MTDALRRFAFPCVMIVTMFGTNNSIRAQQSTSATYDTWVVQCNYDKATPPNKTCAASQVAMLQGKNTPFSRLVVGKATNTKQMALLAQVPVNVGVRNPLMLKLDDASAMINVPFDRCVPDGCFAELDLKDDLVKRFRASDGAGKMSFRAADGRELSVPFSLKGFRAAYDAISKD